MIKELDVLFANLLSDDAVTEMPNGQAMAELIEHRKKRDAAMVKASEQHSKDIAQLQKEVSALKNRPASKCKSIADFSMKDWGEVLAVTVGGALVGYGVAVGMNYLLSDNEQA